MPESSRMHREAWDLIPWIVNGSASPRDQQTFEAHLRYCAECREELQFQRRVHGAVLEEPSIELPDDWALLRARLHRDGQIARGPASPTHVSRPARASAWTAALAAVVVLEGFAIGALGTALWWTERNPAPGAVYQTLASPQAMPQGATIRIVLSPGMTLEQLQKLLRNAGLTVVAGPSDSGVWSLAPSGASSRTATRASLRQLRADPGVRFAEPIGTP